MPIFYDADGSRTARIAVITRRLDEINGFVRGLKRDRSAAAQSEAAILKAEWQELGELNHAEARKNIEALGKERA